MTRVRPATPEDASAILDLHVAAIRAFGPEAYDDPQVAAWAEKDGGPERYPIEEDGHHLVVAVRDESVVAYGHLVESDDEVRAVYVHPDHAGRGVGSTVLARLEDRARSRGSPRLELWSSKNAVGFYEWMGYRPVEEVEIERSYDGRRVAFPVVAMRKALDG